MPYQLKSEEQLSVEAMLVAVHDLDPENIKIMFSELDKYLEFPYWVVTDQESDTTDIAADTKFHHAKIHNPRKLISRKLGNFSFKWKQMLDEQDALGFGLGLIFDGISGYLIAYKIMRFANLSTKIEYDERDAVVFYCLHQHARTRKETTEAWEIVYPCIKEHLGYPLSHKLFQKSLDTLAETGIIAIIDNKIHFVETVTTKEE